MRHRLLLAFALVFAAAGARPASAADAAPVGRWVGGAAGERKVVNLLADASYQLELRGGDKVVSSTGTYEAKDGHLVLTQAKGEPINFVYALEKGRLKLAMPGQPLEKGLSLSIDAGPIVGKWRSEKLESTWTFGADGGLETVEASGTLNGAFEIVYAEPEETEGNLVIHNADKTSLIFHFALEEKATRLVIGGGPTAKDPSAKFTFERLGDAGAKPATPPQDGGPKRPKFPAAPKLPGGGGGGVTPATPTGPVAPAPEAPATPAPAPEASGGLTWDTTAIVSRGYKILKSNYDADGGTMSWVVEATKDQGFKTMTANFYDADEIRIHIGYLDFSPSNLAKGERARVSLPLAPSSILKKTVKIVLVSG